MKINQFFQQDGLRPHHAAPSGNYLITISKSIIDGMQNSQRCLQMLNFYDFPLKT